MDIVCGSLASGKGTVVSGCELADGAQGDAAGHTYVTLRGEIAQRAKVARTVMSERTSTVRSDIRAGTRRKSTQTDARWRGL